MLNLTTQMAGQDMKPARTSKVGGAKQLPVIPMTAAFIDAILWLKHLCFLGEMTTKNYRRGP